MKSKFTSLITLLLLTLTSISAQENSQKIDSSYVKYFQDTREVPYLHLNKTSFLKGEEIWFKAYVTEQNTQKLHPTTSNLYISIFDEAGKLKDQQLVHIKKGLGYGSISLDSSFTKQNYYLKASTKWMKNFNEDHSFSQKIKIISSKKKKKIASKSEKEYFEFKLFPEGGHLVANTVNNLGILIKDANNKGQKVTKGVIKDLAGNVVKEFTTNTQGLGSATLFFNEFDAYTFEATLDNGSVITEKTPAVDAIGIALWVDNNRKDKLIIRIGTNESTLKSIAGKSYKVMVHNTRNYQKHYIPINSSNTNYDMIVNKNKLSSGVNIVTVFNEKNIPLAERLVFIDSKELYSDVAVDKANFAKDSVDVSFRNTSGEKLFLSASFLPKETKAYNPKYSILVAKLLKPYVKGDIENSQFYFAKNNKKRQQNLDLLLLTQGWSKYNWNQIFYTPPKLNYPFEHGIDVTTNINKTLKEKQSMLIYSPDNKLVREVRYNENPFVLKNSFVKKNSVINFALKSKNGLFKIRPAISYSNNTLYDSFASFDKAELNNELEISNFKGLSKDIEVLDEVVVEAAKKREYDNDAYGLNTMLLGIKMENLIINSGETVFDFLRQRGYTIYTNVNGEVVMGARGVAAYNNNTFSVNETIELTNRLPVRVFLDGDEVSQSLWMVENIYLNTVKEIFYGRNHDNRSLEQVHIYTLSPLEYDVWRSQYTKVKLPVGFAAEKEYYNPKYPSFVNSTYKRFGAIFWDPNIAVPANASTTIKIPVNLQDEVNVYIEGVTESGKLLSKKQTINVKK